MSNFLRVLFIGQSGAEAVAAELKRGGYQPTVETIAEPAQLSEALGSSWDVVISDFESSTCSSLEALSAISDRGTDLPLIVISANADDAGAIATLRAGAVDQLPAGNLIRLNAIVERELRAARMRRDRDLLASQNYQSEKMAALARLAGSVAHDLNNMLTIITGYSDLTLSSSDLSESDRSSLDQIRRSSERAGQLTNQLLAFSRPQPTQVRPIRIHELVSRLATILSDSAPVGIEVVTIANSSEDEVEVDPNRLEQIITHLVMNACEAMPNGGKLTIGTGTTHLAGGQPSTQIGVKPGKYALIVVADNGRGMSGETHSRAFEPFYSTKKGGRGFGFGLSTSYSLARQLGGAVRLESELGNGTTATIYLPLAADSKSANPKPISRAAKGASDAILLVADETRARKLLSGMLENHGYAPIEAASADEALGITRNRKGAIDLAVIDVIQPNTSKIDLAHQLTAISPGVRVLYLAGQAEEPALRLAERSTRAEFLRKPFSSDELLLKLREMFEGRRNTAHE